MSFDPRLRDALMQVQDPDLRVILGATALVEAHGATDVTGDAGDSEGPYQENIHGRGKGLSVSQRRDPYAATQRALREFSFFKRKGHRGADLAFVAQRPRDRASYIAAINEAIPKARAALSGGASATTPTVSQPGSTAGSVAPEPPRFLNIREISPEAGAAAAISKTLGGAFTSPKIDALVSLGTQGTPAASSPAQTSAAPAATKTSASVTPAKGATSFAAAPDYEWAQKVAAKFGLKVTSTKRDAADQARIYAGTGKRAQFTSRHLTQGAAADIGGSPEQMAKLARWAINSGLFAEVFYDPVGQWDNGRFSPRGIGGHSDHVHLSFGAPALGRFYPGR